MNDERDPRIELVESGFAAFNRGDMEAVLMLLDPAVESRVVEPLLNAGEWAGRDGYVRMVAAWVEPWSSLDMEVTEIELYGEDAALAHVHQTGVGRSSGVPVELDVVFLFELRSGLATRQEVHPSRESALAALQSRS